MNKDDMERLLDAMRWQESRGNVNAVSPKGAMGPYQFMPETAKELRIDPFDEKQARKGAEQYMNVLLNQSGGNTPEALARWNWGMGNVSKKGVAAAPKETKDFVAAVMQRAGLAPTLVASAPVAQAQAPVGYPITAAPALPAPSPSEAPTALSTDAGAAVPPLQFKVAMPPPEAPTAPKLAAPPPEFGIDPRLIQYAQMMALAEKGDPDDLTKLMEMMRAQRV